DRTPGCDSSCVAASPGLGESRATAAPFPGCPTAPGSKVRLDPPSCFPVSGPIQWYSHVAGDEVLSVSADAPGAGALFDPPGPEIRCSPDTTEIPVATFAAIGQEYYVAVSLPSAMTCLDIDEHPNTGVRGTLTDLNVTFPPNAWGSVSPTFRYG